MIGKTIFKHFYGGMAKLKVRNRVLNSLTLELLNLANK